MASDSDALNQFMGEAAKDPEVVAAAERIRDELPSCIEAVNEAMHAYERIYSELIAINNAVFGYPIGAVLLSPKFTKPGIFDDTMEFYDHVAKEFDDNKIGMAMDFENWYAPFYTLVPGHKVSSIPDPFPYGPPDAGSWGPADYIRTKSNGTVLDAPYSQEKQTDPDKLNEATIASFSIDRIRISDDGGIPQPPMFSFRQESFGGHTAYSQKSAEIAGDSTALESMERGTPFIEELYIEALKDPDKYGEVVLEEAFGVVKGRNHGGFGVGLHHIGYGGKETLLSLVGEKYWWTDPGADVYGPVAAPSIFDVLNTERQSRVDIQEGASVAESDRRDIERITAEKWEVYLALKKLEAACQPSELPNLGPGWSKCHPSGHEGMEAIAEGTWTTPEGVRDPWPAESFTSRRNRIERYKAEAEASVQGWHGEGTGYSATGAGDPMMVTSEWPPKMRWHQKASIFLTQEIPTVKGRQKTTMQYVGEEHGQLEDRPLYDSTATAYGDIAPGEPGYISDAERAAWGKDPALTDLGGTVVFKQHSREEIMAGFIDFLASPLAKRSAAPQGYYGLGSEYNLDRVYGGVDAVNTTGGTPGALRVMREKMLEAGTLLDKIEENSRCIQEITDGYDGAFLKMLRDIEQEVTGPIDAAEIALNFYCRWARGDTRLEGPTGKTVSAEGCTDRGKRKQEEHNKASQEHGLGEILITSEYGRRILYREQCFLLSFINEFIDYKVNKIENKYEAAKRTEFEGGVAHAKRLPYHARGKAAGEDGGITANACVMASGDPYGFINRLTQNPTQAELFKIEPHKLGHLQPMIRLFKIEYGAGTVEQQREIPFEQSSKDIADALSDKNKRGAGVGIKKFLFVYDGSNPFAAKKSIKAKLVIFSNSFDDLLKDRGGWRYVDLALKTGGSKLAVGGEKLESGEYGCRKSVYEENENLSKLNFRLKAVVGYARPSNDAFLTQAQKDAIYNSYVTLNLTPTVHDFAFDDMGRVTLTINYLAYVEDFFDQGLFNIFSDVDIIKQQTHRRLQMKKWRAECEADEINKIKESFAEEVLEEKRTSVQSVVARLLRRNKIKYINIPYKQIQRFTKFGPFAEMTNFDVGDLIRDSESTQEDWETLVHGALENYGASGLEGTEKKGLEAALAVTNPNSESLPFFYVSDLVDVILEQIDEALEKMPPIIDELTENTVECDREVEKDKYVKFKKQFERFRCLLGPFEVINPANVSESFFASMGDIPIALKYFIGWLTNNLAKKNESVYPLAKFLNDLFNNLIKNFLNSDDCYAISVKQKIRVQQAALTSYPQRYQDSKGPTRDEFTAAILQYDNNQKEAASHVFLHEWWRQPFLNVHGPSDSPIAERTTESEINYLAFFAGRTQPLEKMKGIRALDERVGIFHYMLGQPNGIIKKINLTKTDSKGLAEVRFEQDGYDGLKQLRVVYDVTAKTFANVQVFPGTYIFVEPLGFAPNMSSYGGGVYDLSEYGIGGYCMVYRSTHVFGPGIAETEIEAKWVNSIEKSAEKEEKEGKEANLLAGDNAAGYNKCSADWRKNASSGWTGEGTEGAFGEVQQQEGGVMGFFRDTIALITS